MQPLKRIFQVPSRCVLNFKIKVSFTRQNNECAGAIALQEMWLRTPIYFKIELFKTERNEPEVNCGNGRPTMLIGASS